MHVISFWCLGLKQVFCPKLVTFPLFPFLQCSISLYSLHATIFCCYLGQNCDVEHRKGRESASGWHWLALAKREALAKGEAKGTITRNLLHQERLHHPGDLDSFAGHSCRRRLAGAPCAEWRRPGVLGDPPCSESARLSDRLPSGIRHYQVISNHRPTSTARFPCLKAFYSWTMSLSQWADTVQIARKPLTKNMVNDRKPP